MRLIVVCLALLHTMTSVKGVGDGFLTPGDIRMIVDTHNAMRRRESATNMRLLEWNDKLASMSLNLTESCTWASIHRNKLRGIVRGFDQLTHNLHVTGVAPDVSQIVAKWAEERYSYRYETGQCNKVCWHYTQLVWATSHAVGCSLRYCRNIENINWGKHGGYMISCLYGPGGNTEGIRPYHRGDVPCSNCSHPFQYCAYGLCSRLMVPTTSTISTTSVSKPSTTAIPKTTVSVGQASHLRSLIGGFSTAIYILILHALSEM